MNMKLKQMLFLATLIVALASCAKNDWARSSKEESFGESAPNGMIFIKSGSFMMGQNSPAIFDQPDNPKMVTINGFWMDETEITNRQYKLFVNWVRDSIAMTRLIEAGIQDFAIIPEDDTEEEEHYTLNWKKRADIWKTKDEEYTDALAPMLYNGGGLRTSALHYRYQWYEYAHAALLQNKFDVVTGTYAPGAKFRVDTFWINEENGLIQDSTVERSYPLHGLQDLVTTKIIGIYPDTLVWLREFQLSYNEPLLHMYFSHKGYADYPVVGVTWEQAHAFCNWRTYHYGNDDVRIRYFRLPTEAEWEYAARGGRDMAMYPWGNNYARDAQGCFFANFKPYRGGYRDDTGTTTMKVAQFAPNDFGLFDMAGNVAEWTNSAYSNTSNNNVHEMNPDFSYMACKDDPDIMKRKVVKGGSWKDISYFLQCGVRSYEYQYESRSYIGFRCVRSYIGK